MTVAVTVTIDANFIVSGSDDKTIALWDVCNKQLVHTFEEDHTDALNSVAAPPGFKLIIPGSDDKTVKI